MIFVKNRLKERVTNLEFDIVKTTTLTGKGAEVIRFNVDDTVISFLNCHLAHGTSNVKTRLKNLYYIHKKSFQTFSAKK